MAPDWDSPLSRISYNNMSPAQEEEEDESLVLLREIRDSLNR